MSFQTQEESVEDGAPIELYKIEGASNFYYTSGSVEFTYDGATYTPVAMSRSGPTVSVKPSSGGLSLKFPFDDPFVTRYLAGVPPVPDRITVYQTHLSDSTGEVKPFWSGPVSGVKFSGEEATVTVGGVAARTQVQIPTNTFSWACNHVLYGPRCGVSEPDYRFSVLITAISDDRTTLSIIDSELAFDSLVVADSMYFNGGRLTPSGSGKQRMMLNFQRPSAGIYSVKLMVPLDDTVSVDDTVTISAGCNRSAQVCNYRFNNSERYGGFPFIPTLNPFATDVKRED
jgi:uncharacterized phage protein (TIGR02218 family)